MSLLAKASLILALLFFSILPAQSAVIIVSDPFNDGGFSNGADPLDVNWLAFNTSSATIDVNNSAATVQLGNNSLIAQSTGSTFHQVYAEFPSITLGSSGNSTLRLAFDFRFNALPVTGSTTGFRFGLGNNSGTESAFGDDFGYRASIALNAAASFGFQRDNQSPSDGNLLGGGDSFNLTSLTGNNFNINTTTAMSVEFFLTRTGTTTVAMEARLYDAVGGSSGLGSLVASRTATDTVPSAAFMDLNTLGIGVGSVINHTYAIDNVTVTAIPEPGSLALLIGISAAGIAAYYRKR